MIGDDLTVMVLGVKGNQVRVGIQAAKSVPVHREEIDVRLGLDRRQDAQEGQQPEPVPSFAPPGVPR